MLSPSSGTNAQETWSVAINGIRSWFNEQGHTELQVSVVDLDDQQERLLNIALNKVQVIGMKMPYLSYLLSCSRKEWTFPCPGLTMWT